MNDYHTNVGLIDSILTSKDWLQLMIDFSSKVAKLFANHIGRFLIFIRYNDPKPIVNQQSVVYEYKCDLCDTNYIGYTRRHLHQRVEEHKHSVIGKHLKDEHSVKSSNLRDNFTILKKCRSKLECLIFEMLFIRKKRPKLNTQVDSIRAKRFV